MLFFSTDFQYKIHYKEKVISVTAGIKMLVGFTRLYALLKNILVP